MGKSCPMKGGANYHLPPPMAGVFKREIVAVMGEIGTVEFESEE